MKTALKCGSSLWSDPSRKSQTLDKPNELRQRRLNSTSETIVKMRFYTSADGHFWGFSLGWKGVPQLRLNCLNCASTAPHHCVTGKNTRLVYMCVNLANYPHSSISSTYRLFLYPWLVSSLGNRLPNSSNSVNVKCLLPLQRVISNSLVSSPRSRSLRSLRPTEKYNN